MCAYTDIKTKEKMWRVLIQHDQLKELLELTQTVAQDSLSAKYRQDSRKIIVSGNGIEIKIAPKALFDWVVPGS